MAISRQPFACPSMMIYPHWPEKRPQWRKKPLWVPKLNEDPIAAARNRAAMLGEGLGIAGFVKTRGKRGHGHRSRYAAA